jgi:hypothetical protein
MPGRLPRRFLVTEKPTSPPVSSTADHTSPTGESRTPPPNYLVLRAGSTQPDRFHASTDADAIERLKREVRAGKTPVVYCYKLWLFEEFVPDSKTTYVSGEPGVPSENQT